MTDIEPEVKSKPKVTPEEILESLFLLEDKPQDLMRADAINVYANRWRVNLWIRSSNPFVSSQGSIVKSYFLVHGKNGIKIKE